MSDDTLGLLLAIPLVYSIGGFVVWLMWANDIAYRRASIGDKTAMVIWCGPIIWIAAIFWLINKGIVNAVDKKFGDKE